MIDAFRALTVGDEGEASPYGVSTNAPPLSTNVQGATAPPPPSQAMPSTQGADSLMDQ